MNNTTSPRPVTDETTEQEIVRKGLVAPRITPADLEAAIASEAYYVFKGSQLTVCCLTLRNGFTVLGESACASPENFDADIGEKVARENAKQKLWPLLGYQLKTMLKAKAERDELRADFGKLHGLAVGAATEALKG